MFKNYFKTAWRNFRFNKAYTAINVIGLAFGMATFIILSAYIHFEKSYDRMHKESDNIYRVESRFYKGNDLTDDWATSTNGYAKAMKDNFPETSSFARINWYDAERVVRYNDIKFREEHVCFADSNFFSFFSFPLLKGNKENVLKDVNTMAISASAAKKYFGSADPIGKFLEVSTISRTYRCMITGVFEDVPVNSTLQFNFLISWATSPQWTRDFWYMHESYTYVKLKPGTNLQNLENKFPALAEKNKSGEAQKDLKWAIHLVPLNEIHLNPAKQYEIESKGNRRAVNILGIMALAILIIANINYINLSTARAISRAKEVGIRKVSGAGTTQLIFQFMLESFLLNGISLLLAVALVLASQSYLRQFIGTTGFLFDKILFIRVAVPIGACVSLSGIYPALVLTRIKAIAVLKGSYASSKGGAFLRKGLVVFQFATSLLLITGTFAVYLQIAFMRNQQLGVNINQTLVVKAPVNTPNYKQKIQSFKNGLSAIPSVAGVTGSGSVPGKQVGKYLANRRYGAPKAEERTYEMLKVDNDFIKTYGLTLVAGRGFDKEHLSDSTALVLNEAAVKKFGFTSPENAIGKKILLETNNDHPNEIIGIIKDYHQQSLQQKITPIILFMDPAFDWIPSNYYSIKLKSKDIPGSVASVEKVWNEIFPSSSFDFFFLDSYYNNQYRQEIQFGKMFLLFSSLAILIACLGLFGLTTHSTARRKKEIGVRKVIGASVPSIIGILGWDAVKLILISSIVALPLSILFIIEWLREYVNRVELTWWQFAAPVICLVLIAVISIGYMTFKAAITNPVESLRAE